MSRVPFRLLFLVAAAASVLADPPLVPYSVCEILRDLPAHEGKGIAVLGRYSFRENGRWIDEQACDPPLDGPCRLDLIEDSRNAPKPPDDFSIDGVVLQKKLTDIRHRTSLGKFRFGSQDYDRWAIVYGQIYLRQGQGPDAPKAAAELVFRGDGVVIFLRP